MAHERLDVIITGHARELAAEFKKVAAEAETTGSKLHGAFNKAAKIGGAALAGIAGAAVAVGVSSIHMADDFDKAHARLETALTNTGTSFDAVSKQVGALEKSGQGLGFNMTEIQGTLAQMTTGLGDVHKATAAFGVVEDLAAAKGIPLADAGLAVTRAMEGQLRPLKQMGIDLPVAAGGALKTKNAYVALLTAQNKFNEVQAAIHAHLLKGPAALKAYGAAQDRVHAAQQKLNSVASAGSDILAALGQKLDGQASAAANTFAGKVKALHVTMENLQIQIGQKLVPIIEKLASVFLGVINWFDKNRSAAQTLGIVVGTLLTAAIGAFVVSLFTAGGALNLFTLATTTAEGVAVAFQVTVLGWALVIAVIIAAIYLLVTHWKEVWAAIQKAFFAAWDAIQAGFHATVDWLKALPGKIVDALASFGHKLLDWATTAFKNLAAHLPRIVAFVVAFFVLLPVILAAAVVVLGVYLVKHFGASFVHLVSQLPALALRLFIWWVELPGKIAEKLIPLGFMLIGKLGAAFVALVKALPGAVADLGSWFFHLPGYLIGKMGDVAGAFFNWGTGIIQAAIDGIRSMAGNLGGAFHGILKGVPGAGVLSHLPGVGGLFSGDVGGWIPGGTGSPLLMVGHGGEYIMSRQELAGRPRADSPLQRVSRSGGGGTIALTVNVLGPSFGANTAYHAATAEAVVNQLVQHQLRRGTHWQFVQGTGPG